MSIYILIAIWLGMNWSYVALMHAKAKRKDLSLYWKVMLYPLLGIGYAINMTLFNPIFGTVMFMELPKDLVFSKRVQRHVDESDGWRLRLALWWARQLNTFDEHIKIPQRVA